MPFEIDTTNWSGEGSFTQLLIDRLREVGGVRFLRVENAPATRADADYNLISNELFVGFAAIDRKQPIKRLGLFPGSRTVTEPAMTFAAFEAALTAMPDVGAPDYSDPTMVQYLRVERIVAPYQTRGYKLVELVRIYEIGTSPRS